MLRLAVQDDPLFEVCSMELDRAGVSYTYDTLVELRRRDGEQAELMWIIGMDMLSDLASWRRAEQVVAMARVITVARPPMPADLDAVLAPLRPRFDAERVRQLSEDILATPLIDISSTQIRRRVAEGKSIAYLTAAPIVQYVRRHRLYGAQP
jgi:nicotinate-nucleotide adenylyltransferase